MHLRAHSRTSVTHPDISRSIFARHGHEVLGYGQRGFCRGLSNMFGVCVRLRCPRCGWALHAALRLRGRRLRHRPAAKPAGRWHESRITNAECRVSPATPDFPHAFPQCPIPNPYCLPPSWIHPKPLPILRWSHDLLRGDVFRYQQVVRSGHHGDYGLHPCSVTVQLPVARFRASVGCPRA